MEESLQKYSQARLRAVFVRVLAIPETLDALEIRRSMASWTSLAHLNLILELEDEFSIAMEIHEMESLNSLERAGEIVKSKLTEQTATPS